MEFVCKILPYIHLRQEKHYIMEMERYSGGYFASFAKYI
jgi:hypothetical protein